MTFTTDDIPDSDPNPDDNMLFREFEYQYTDTGRGVWKRFLSQNGNLFEEYTSHAALGSLPLVHLTKGINPETGKRKTARGVIAIGRSAVGVLAIGQAAWGVIAIGQLAVGILLGLGQAATGVVCIGQVALGVLFGCRQISTGYVAIGQFAAGKWVLAMLGAGTNVIDMRGTDPDAKEFFETLLDQL